MPKRLLYRDTGHFVQPGILRVFLQGRQHAGGLMVADLLLVVVPGVSPCLQHVVVGKASRPERPGQDGFLVRRRVESEFVGSLDFHGSHNILKVCEDQNKLPAILPRLKLVGILAEVS